MYCYWDFIEEKKSDGPKFKECDKASSVLHPIMYLDKQCPFGIVEIDFMEFEKLKQYSYIEKVPDHLFALLESSDSYPPARVLAREDIDGLNLDETITKDEFTEIAVKRLHKYFERQGQDGITLAEVLVPYSYETSVGQFKWIIGYTPKIKLIHFAGWDFFRDTDHVSCFKLTEQQIEQLPIVEMETYTLVVDCEKRKWITYNLTDESLDLDRISEKIRTTR